MRRSRTVIAFLASSAIVIGCSSGRRWRRFGRAELEAPAASSPAASESASASAGGGTRRCNPPKQDGVTLSFTSFGGVYQEAQRGVLTPYTELTGVQFTEDENLERDDQDPGRVRPGDVGRRRRRQRLRP